MNYNSHLLSKLQSIISYDKKIISKRQFEVIGKAVIEIRKIAFGVLKIEKEKESKT